MNTLQCTCGKKFRSYAAEARHRHSFPLLCKPPEPESYSVVVEDGGYLDHNGKGEWKDIRTAKAHAYDYMVAHGGKATIEPNW